MNFIKYAVGMFVFAGIISLIAGSGGNYFTQSVNAQSLGEQIGNSIGGALDETGEAVGNVTEGASKAANETGEAVGNATEGAANETGQAADNATESLSGAANETGQAADNATTSGNSSNPLEMLMNLFKGNK